MGCGSVTSSCLLVVSGLRGTFLMPFWVTELEATLCWKVVLKLLLLSWLQSVSSFSCFLDF